MIKINTAKKAAIVTPQKKKPMTFSSSQATASPCKSARKSRCPLPPKIKKTKGLEFEVEYQPSSHVKDPTKSQFNFYSEREDAFSHASTQGASGFSLSNGATSSEQGRISCFLSPDSKIKLEKISDDGQ